MTGTDLSKLALLLAFNVLYVRPRVAVLLVRRRFGVRAGGVARADPDAVEPLAPVVLAVLTFALGVALMLHGARGLEDS